MIPPDHRAVIRSLMSRGMAAVAIIAATGLPPPTVRKLMAEIGFENKQRQRSEKRP
jgi:hypothetical protein